MHQLGYGWYPMHDQYRGRILQHIATIKPALGIIMTEDAAPIGEAYAAHKHTIIARVWAIDDHNGDAGRALAADPERAAADLMDRYCRKRDEWMRSGAGMPGAFDLLGHAWNEPNQHASYEQIAAGTKALLRRSILESFPMCVLNLGVGHPSGLHPDGSVDWSAFDDEELADLIEASGSIVGLHGYWQVEGPMHQWTDSDGRVRRDYPFLAGRHHSFPLDVSMAITECGVDGGIYGRNPGWGWQAYRLEKQAYTNQLLANHQALDDRVLAMCPFGLDYQNKEWASFNYVDCLSRIEEWVARVDADIPVPPPIAVHIPNVGTGPREVGIIDPRTALAIMDIEAGGQGHNTDGSLRIRFEAHIFQHQLANEARFRQHFLVSDERAWAEPQFYKDQSGNWQEIHTGDQAHEYAAFRLASMMDPEAAARSISMGIAQIMGFNHARVGYPSAQAMYRDYSDSEAAQVLGFVNYVLSDAELLRAVRAKDWRTVARLYNGSGQVDLYSGRLKAAYEARG